MIPTEIDQKDICGEEEEKDFEQIRRENTIDDKGKHAVRLRSACQQYSG